MFTIPIKEGSPTALPFAEVGRGSAFRARLTGVSPELENVEVHFATPTNASGSAVKCEAVPGGEWRVYASGLYFPDEGRARYRVSARTPQGDSVHLGAGTLEIVPSSINVEESALPIVPEDTYLRNPATGLWHKFTCTFEDGMLTPNIAKEGITR
jgi:hypothetical protein